MMQQANVSAKILVDYFAATTPTNLLNAQGTQVNCYPLGTLVYTPAGVAIVKTGHGTFPNFYPAYFSFSQGSGAAPVEIFGYNTIFRLAPAIQFNGLALAPTSPALATPTPINVDGATNVIYGVVGSGPMALFVTITLCNLRSEVGQ